MGRGLGDVVRLIDSTSQHPAEIGTRWAQFSAKVCGAKMQVVIDPDASVPAYHAVAPAKVNDNTAAKAMAIERGATSVFNLGYDDYGWWAMLDRAQGRIVTRLRTNTPLVQGTFAACPDIERAVRPNRLLAAAPDQQPP